MDCPECLAANRQEANYCCNCGFYLKPLSCQSCGTPVDGGKRFCLACGCRLPGAREGEGNYLPGDEEAPRHLPVFSFDGNDAERKHITVLFAVG